MAPMVIIASRKPCVVRAAMVEPTWAETNRPQAAPAIARPMRSSTWADFRTRNRIEAPCRLPCNELTLYAAGTIQMRAGAQSVMQEIVSGDAVPAYRAPNVVAPNSAFWVD